MEDSEKDTPLHLDPSEEFKHPLGKFQKMKRDILHKTAKSKFYNISQDDQGKNEKPIMINDQFAYDSDEEKYIDMKDHRITSKILDKNLD